MKLTLQQLQPHLSTQLLPLYLVSGDEPVLKQEALQLIRKAAQQAGFTERVRLQGEAGLDENQLYTALYSPSLSAEKMLIELDFRSKAPAKPLGAIIEKYLAAPAASLLIIMDTAKLEDSHTRSAWYKAAEKTGATVTLWPIPREQLPQWIMNRARKYKINLQADAAALLTDYVEGNLTAAAQTLEKIYLLKHDKPIDAQLIQSILADESRFTIFDLTEAMISDNIARTLHILETLRLDGTEAVIVLWGITRELRLLAAMASEQQTGMPLDEIFRKHRVFSRRQMGVRRFLSRFNREKCYQYLKDAAAIDTILKGGMSGNSWQALQMLCMKLA